MQILNVIQQKSVKNTENIFIKHINASTHIANLKLNTSSHQQQENLRT